MPMRDKNIDTQASSLSCRQFCRIWFVFSITISTKWRTNVVKSNHWTLKNERVNVFKICKLNPMWIEFDSGLLDNVLDKWTWRCDTKLEYSIKMQIDFQFGRIIVLQWLLQKLHLNRWDLSTSILPITN